jgi:hypothetical protein
MRQRRALEAAKIDPGVCVWWNAVPYHLGYKGEIAERDRANGVRYLLGFVSRCSELRVVVAMGAGARSVATRAWRQGGDALPPLILTPHPMIYGRNARERIAELAEQLQEVTRLVRTS